jgi:hypothetical protein
MSTRSHQPIGGRPRRVVIQLMPVLTTEDAEDAEVQS